jgi:hypothetical protein
VRDAYIGSHYGAVPIPPKPIAPIPPAYALDKPPHAPAVVPTQPEHPKAVKDPLELVGFNSRGSIEVANNGPISVYLIRLLINEGDSSKSYGLGVDVGAGKVQKQVIADGFTNTRTLSKLADTWKEHLAKVTVQYPNCWQFTYFSPLDVELQQIKDNYAVQGTSLVYDETFGTIYYKVSTSPEIRQQRVPVVVTVTLNSDTCPFDYPRQPVQPRIQPQTGGGLTKVDRENLAKAFFEFSQVLDQANAAWGKANNLKSDESGPLGQNLVKRRSKIPEIQKAATDFNQNLINIRQKWNYYEIQTNAIFDENPNDPLILLQIVNEYASELDAVLTIKNADDSQLQKVLRPEDIRYDEGIVRFSQWYQGCEQRLQQARSVLR